MNTQTARSPDFNCAPQYQCCRECYTTTGCPGAQWTGTWIQGTTCASVTLPPTKSPTENPTLAPTPPTQSPTPTQLVEEDGALPAVLLSLPEETLPQPALVPTRRTSDDSDFFAMELLGNLIIPEPVSGMELGNPALRAAPEEDNISDIILGLFTGNAPYHEDGKVPELVPKNVLSELRAWEIETHFTVMSKSSPPHRH